ncbi:MAG: ATPase [Bacteroides sp.]|nr:ATPase [Bacteroides sp.]
MKRSVIFLAAALAATTLSAKDEKGDDETLKPKFTPVGTILIDGAVYASPQKGEFPDGVALPDARLGVIMNYGKWSAKVEASYAYSAVTLKDVWMQYSFNPQNFIRAGLAMQHFGYQNSTAACMKVTMIEPVSNTVFNEPHMLGVGYYHLADRYFLTASVHAEPKASTLIVAPDQLAREGYGVRMRAVARPFHSDGVMLQAGMSGAWLTPQFTGTPDTHDSFTFGANMPTKVTLHKAIGATVDHARNQWKFTPELMGAWHKVALESQYFFSQVNRRDALPAYRAYGAYATLRGIALGKDYAYNMALAGIDTPGKGTLEWMASYNYTCLSDASSAIYGGRLSDVSCGLNYYFNRYFTAKLRYSYTHVWDRADAAPVSLNAVQMRLQVIF